MKYIYKDYQLRDKALVKEGIDDNKHLMWQPGFDGVPCIDARLWDKHEDKIDRIIITSLKGRIFTISKRLFNKHKQQFNYGFGAQYSAPKKKWKTQYKKVNRELEDYTKFLC